MLLKFYICNYDCNYRYLNSYNYEKYKYDD